MSEYDDRTPEKPQRNEHHASSGDESIGGRRTMSGCGVSALLGLGSLALLWIIGFGVGGPGGFVVLMQLGPVVLFFAAGCAVFGIVSLFKQGERDNDNAAGPKEAPSGDAEGRTT